MKKILFVMSVFAVQQVFAAKISLHAVPSVALEATSPERVDVDTNKLFEAVDEVQGVRVNGWTLLLSVKSLPKEIETLKVSQLDDASIQPQCSSVKVTETDRVEGEGFVEALYTINYDLNGDDGANYCAVSVQQGNVKKVLRFGFTVND